jgi:hypothetical protein
MHDMPSEHSALHHVGKRRNATTDRKSTVSRTLSFTASHSTKLPGHVQNEHGQKIYHPYIQIHATQQLLPKRFEILIPLARPQNMQIQQQSHNQKQNS